MRLKSLEIKGFKSFADKTVINFDEGITGIIGPNGCGKSNIVDSIRWVIGEHKISNLRSENLESLVFNGSRSRSASGLAEVSLTFENTRNLLPTEFNTVTVTRKFYKSGESEYRLNDVQCRLKDIHNLFLDTGVSTDSYAIIELGMVDDIIKDKDNSRRKMLEQAAGISIYKTRKKEARLKLDATEQDLARIEDLIYEINNQLKSLESQARKAERYYEVKKEYRTTSVEYAKAALEGFNDTYKELTEQQTTESDRKLALETVITTEEAAMEQEKLTLVQQERVLQSLQLTFNELVGDIRNKESEKNLAAQRLQYLGERERSLQDFLTKASVQLNGIEESIAFTEQQLQEEEDKSEDFGARVEDGKAEVEEKRRLFDAQRASIDIIRRDNLALQRQQFESEKQVAVGDASIQNIQRAIQQLANEQDQRRLQQADLERERTDKEAELEERRDHLRLLQEQHDTAKQQIFDTQAILEQLRARLAQENRVLDAKMNEHNLLKSLIDSMEGYPESVKFLHKNQGWNHTAPILSDIIYVKEEYRAALENVLEPYLNYYVVNNLAEGMQAVRLLDANKKGKANFFLLDQLAGIKISGSKGETPAACIPALDVVEFDPVYNHLVHHLLGGVVIAETEEALDAGISDWVVLEKTGRFVKGHYALSGGSVGLFEGKKIGRAKNLEKLVEQIEAQERTVGDLKQEIQQRHDEVIGFNQQLRDREIRQTQDQISDCANKVFALQNKIETLQQSGAMALQRISDLENQLADSQDSISGARASLESFNEQLDILQDRLRTVEEEYANAEQEYNFANAAYNELNLQFTRQQARRNALKQELEFKMKQVTDLRSQIDNSSRQLEDAAAQMQTTAETLRALEATLLEMFVQKEEDERQLNAVDQAYYNMRNALSTKEGELRQKIREKEQVDEVLNLIKDRVNELRLQLAGIKERLSVEFKVQLEQIMDEPRTTQDSVEDLQAACERMKKRLENMGEVNPTAIEAFTEMKKRYDFIVEQKNDLMSAKDTLMQTIQEVEATANQKFLDTFNQVRENFQKVFKALFTEEDTADMVLENPENLAETGIDIVAKPKGKRPTSITQLSGGEKTLTATALLFAIYLIKPAPFCILDEVDAPLDDANVGKFTKMIRQFSKESQFIIVTHNKTTMSTVDIIYGVTMQEAGVSKLVAVDFRNLQEQETTAKAS